MFRQILLLCFLIAGLNQLTSGAVANKNPNFFSEAIKAAAKITDQTGEEDTESYLNLKVVYLKKDVQTAGSKQVSQLICEEMSDDEKADKVCPTYAADEAECFNRNYKKSDVPDFVCDLTNARYTNPAITVEEFVAECEHPDETNSQYFIIGSCFGKYKLRKESNYKKENDVDRDAKDKDKDKGLSTIAIVFIVIGVLAVVTLISLCVVSKVYPNSAVGQKLSCLN